MQQRHMEQSALWPEKHPSLGTILAVSDAIEDEQARFLEDLNASARKAHERAGEQIRRWLDYELKHRKCPYPDEDAILQAIRTFYDTLQIRYYVEISTGRAANTNDAAKEFQDNLDKACRKKQSFFSGLGSDS
jgi:hypothetical protein